MEVKNLIIPLKFQAEEVRPQITIVASFAKSATAMEKSASSYQF